MRGGDGICAVRICSKQSTPIILRKPFQPLEPKLVGGIVRSGGFLGLSPMVEGGTRCRVTTSAGGAEIRRTYWHGLPTTLTDEVEDEGNAFTRLQERPK
jgi:hypothetical protein